MGEEDSKKDPVIRAEMTVLDVVSKYRETEAVFMKYDKEAGECICCHALFEPLKKVAEKYQLSLDGLLTDLAAAAKQGS